MAEKRKSIKVPTKDDGSMIRRRPLTDAVADSHAAFAAKIGGEVGTEQHPELDPAMQELVTATVPKTYKLRRVDHTEETILSGVQEMPRWKAEHWWSKAMGVTIYEGKR